jgi:NTP pyrophosphatase (non-canonical NTP hydrolase)
VNERNLEDMKKEIQKFCEKRNWDQFHNAKELSIGIATEASELLEHFRFKSEKEVKEVMEDQEKSSKIEEELADVLYFILRFSQMYNIDLIRALEEKMDQNRKKYPIDKAKDSNKKYNELGQSDSRR